jgi:hypothetical protein
VTATLPHNNPSETNTTNGIGSVSETYRGGDRVIYSGEYCLVDSQGRITDFEILTLDEGETFPVPIETDLLYQLHFEIGDPISDGELCREGFETLL